MRRHRRYRKHNKVQQSRNGASDKSWLFSGWNDSRRQEIDTAG